MAESAAPVLHVVRGREKPFDEGDYYEAVIRVLERIDADAR